jgi:hypothetical protein
MIELRIVENGMGMRTDIQYRHHQFGVDASGALCPFSPEFIWSEWRTAEWVKAEEIEND